MPRKRVVWLVVGWVAAGFAHYYAVLFLVMRWNFFDWSPKVDVVSVLLGAGITLTLVGIWFLAKTTRDRVSQIVSAVVCLLLARTLAMGFFGPERLSGGWLGRSEPSPWWFRGGLMVLFLLPAAFWLWHLWLPHASQAARHRIIAVATCIFILSGVAFKEWDARKRAEMAAIAPITSKNDLGDQLSAAFADALMKGGPAPKPDPKAWQRIRVGLSREEVLAILGQPATKMKQNPPADAAVPPSALLEWWEYGYSSPIGTDAVDPRAYALFFDESGRVKSFQEPSEPAK